MAEALPWSIQNLGGRCGARDPSRRGQGAAVHASGGVARRYCGGWHHARLRRQG